MTPSFEIKKNINHKKPTIMKEDETRVYNDKNAYLNNAEDETVKAETTVSEDETAMAPEAAKKSSAKGNNAAFAAAGAVAGAAVGAGVSAAAMKHGDNKFTKEADAEVKPEEEVAGEPKGEAKSDEELLNAPAGEKGGETSAIEHTSGTPAAEAPANGTPAAEVTPVAAEAPETEVNATEVQPVQVNVTVNINGAPAETGEVKTVVPEPEVEVHSVGTIMDEEGNVVNHAEVTVDGVDAVLLDVDNNGTIDVAIVDSDGDGQVTIEDAMDMSDTGLTMDDVAQHMMGQDDQMPDDTMI